MPALAPYIPNQNSKFILWFENFSTLISASPGTYGLLSSDATTIAGDYSTVNAAYQLLTSPTTKTAATVAAYNTARASVLPAIRNYAQTISNNLGVTTGNKIALGLNPKTSTPTPISAPASNPVLTLQSQSPGQAIIRYRDSAASVSVKSKPYGVKTCVVYATVGTAAATQVLTATKSPFLLPLAQFGAAGTAVTLSAKWATQRQLMSPLSPALPITTT